MARIPYRSLRRAAGFSLVELLVATSISGVLASIAYPTFTGSVHKIRRTDALVALMQVQQAEERFRSDGSRYGSLEEIGMTSMVGEGRYVLSVDRPTATGYHAFAVAAGSQTGDTGCRYLKVVAAEGDWILQSGSTAAVDNDAAANRRCWNQ
jgi:type IV pilus assembly protein PilE